MTTTAYLQRWATAPPAAPDGHFRCEMCGQVFPVEDGDDDVARAEAESKGIDPADSGLVCDACYATTPWGQPVTPGSLPPCEIDASTDALRDGLARAARVQRGHSATITVGDVTIPVRSWEVVADEGCVPRAALDARDAPRRLLSDSGSSVVNLSGTWSPLPRPGSFAARSRRRVDGVWVTVKAY